MKGSLSRMKEGRGEGDKMTAAAGRSLVSARIDLGPHALRVCTTGNGVPHFTCLHGLADTFEVWSKVAALLAQHGQVVMLDQRAHGESTAPPGPYTRDDLAADVIAVLDRLQIDRTILIAHSMGGMVALAAALSDPERVAGLVLLGTASQCSARMAAWYERIATAAETDGCDGLARSIYGDTKTPRVRGDARGLAHVTRCLKSLHTDPLTPKLAAIACPTLVLVGEKDLMGPKASTIIYEQISGSRLEVVPSCGHWIHIEAPEVLLRAVTSLVPTA
jgi:3-oxoadipate enol-lactonase